MLLVITNELLKKGLHDGFYPSVLFLGNIFFKVIHLKYEKKKKSGGGASIWLYLPNFFENSNLRACPCKHVFKFIINLVLVNFFILYPMKTQENQTLV